MSKREDRRRKEVKRIEQVTRLANEEGYDTVIVYKKKRGFVAYEANDMYHHKAPIYIVVEYDDNTPYLALKTIVDEM